MIKWWGLYQLKHLSRTEGLNNKPLKNSLSFSSFVAGKTEAERYETVCQGLLTNVTEPDLGHVRSCSSYTDSEFTPEWKDSYTCGPLK